jgi:hypothetical protein
MTPEPTSGPVTTPVFAAAPDPDPAPAPCPDPDAPTPAEPGARGPAMAAETLTLTADRFAPTDDALDMIRWDAERVSAAYGITDPDVTAEVVKAASAALAFAILSRYGTGGIEPDGDPGVTIAAHLARLTDIPREAHHDLLVTATRVYAPVGITVDELKRLSQLATDILARPRARRLRP